MKAPNSTFLFIVLLFTFSIVKAQKLPADKVIGKWVSDKKNLIVEINKYGQEYTAKIIWFNDKDEPNYPMNARTDFRNPNPSLRKRKLIGMEVLKSLKFNESSLSWENGLIYDSRSGKEWNACVYMTADGEINVKGYWHFKFIGKTMSFKSVNFVVR